MSASSTPRGRHSARRLGHGHGHHHKPSSSATESKALQAHLRDNYYIYSSAAGKSPGTDVKVLQSGKPIDKFVTALNSQHVIVLDSAPVTQEWVEFDIDDETAAWMRRIDPRAVPLLTVDDTPAQNIAAFCLRFEDPWSLVFSSAADVLLFTFGAGTQVMDPGARIPPPGLISDNGSILACGLDFTQTPQIHDASVGHLFEYVGLSSLADRLPPGVADMGVSLKTPGRNDPPRRNALWFQPGSAMQTTIRLQFQLQALETLQNLLGDVLKGFTLSAADVITKKNVVLAATEIGMEAIDNGSVAFSVSCSVQAGTSGAPMVDMLAGVEFWEAGISLVFVFASKDPLSGIVKWLAWLTDDETLESFVDDMLNKAENGIRLLAGANLRRMSIGLDTRQDSSKPTLSSFSIDIEVTANFGRGDKDNYCAFLVSYSWSKFNGKLGSLAGHLWTEYDTNQNLDLLPLSEAWNVLQPVTRPLPAKSIDLVTLIPGQVIANIPDTVPTQITRAYLELSANEFRFGAAIEAAQRSPESVPQPYLGMLSADISFSWGTSSAFTLDLGIMAGIAPSIYSARQTPARLTGQLSYASATKSWGLKATLNGLYASTLAEFFGSGSSDHVMPLIESIAISELSVEYKYTGAVQGRNKGQSVGSEFTIQGSLLIAGLDLDLYFHTNSNGWEFSAAMNPQNADATIGDVLLAIMGEDDDLQIPDFVSNMKVVGGNSDALRIDVTKTKTMTTDGIASEAFTFLAQVNVGDLSLTFAQLHSSDWGPEEPSKRLFKVAITGFPQLSIDVPLIGTIDQPFDEMYYLWVQDLPAVEPRPPTTTHPDTVSSGPRNRDIPGFARFYRETPRRARRKPSAAVVVGTGTRVAGLTRKDVEQLNVGLKDKLMVMDKYKEQKATDLLVSAGSHFAVIIRSSTGDRSCLLDYDFMRPADDKAEDDRGVFQPYGRRRLATVTEPADEEAGSAQVPLKKKKGPLSISDLGLKYKSKKLIISLNATFDLGPVGFSLLGFSLGVQWQTLDQLPQLSASIDGLSTVFDKPPLTIAGIVRHGNTGDIDYYAGGLIVGFDPYQFQAAGFYGKVTPPDPRNLPYTSVFVFAKLDGPLVTLTFAEITGVTAGFGYNSSVREPAPPDVSQFPFIASTDLGGASSALQALQTLTDPGPAGWFRPLNNAYWAAAGMKVNAFKMLSLDAVVVVQFGGGTSLKLGIFGLAIADVPSAASPFKFAHVELGISVTLDLDYGVLKAEAQLSPRSFVLDPSCHLTGGMALYYWFDAPHADKTNIGNFVFTIGGYHAAFSVPVGYPTPPRLAISWSLGKNLSVSGQAYFAITPKACMGGGRLRATFNAGPVSAWFDAFADFLINYQPFAFQAQAGIAVGIAFNLDVLFIHTHISCEIGAQLYLWGPPLAGRVHVDFWILAFDINFGDSAGGAGALTLYQFYLLVLQASGGTTHPRRLASTTTEMRHVAGAAKSRGAADDGKDAAEHIIGGDPPRPMNEGHEFLPQTGLMNASDDPQRPAGQPWTVRGGIFSFTVGCKMAANIVKQSRDGHAVFTYGEVYAKPMHLTRPVTSTLVIELTQGGVVRNEGWQLSEAIKSMPAGLWGKYNASQDPMSGGNNIKDLLNAKEGSVPLMMGVEVLAPKAQISPDPYPAYDVTDADLRSIMAERPFPPWCRSSDTWAPGKPYTGGQVTEQYKAVRDAWTDPGWGTSEEGQRGFVGIWADAFGWDSGFMSSVAGIPEKLKQRFDNLYIAAPLLTR